MKKIYTLFVFIFLFQIQNTNAQAPFWNWAATAGGVNSDRAGAITYTADGNLLVTGFFSDDATFGSTVLSTTTTAGMFIAKYSTNGNLLWAKKTGEASGGFEPRQIFEDASGNILVSGYFGEVSTGGSVTFSPSTTFSSYGGRDAFVSKFDSAGDLIWAKHIGTADEDVMVASSNGDGFILQGSAFSNLYADNLTTVDSLTFTGNWRIWLGQYNATGALTKFSDVITNGSFMTPAAIKSDDSGMIYITGMYYSHPVVGVIPDTASLPNAGGYYDIYLVKIDSFSFHRQWQQRIHGGSSDEVKAMDFDSAKNLIVTGSYTAEALFGTLADTMHLHAATGANEFFISSYDTSGILVWAKNAGYSNGGAVTPYSITHSDSLIYIVGHYTGTPVFGEGADTTAISWATNFFVAAYTDSGSLHWVRGSDGSFSDGLNGVTVDDSGFVYPAGYFTFWCILDTSATDTIYLNSEGVDDVFVGRIGYKISVEDTTGDTTIIIRVNAMNFPENFMLFPNPADKNLNVALNENASMLTVTVYDLAGRLIFSEKSSTIDRKLNLDISNFADGTYLIQIKSTDKLMSGKFSVFRNE